MSNTTTTPAMQFTRRAAAEQRCWVVDCRAWVDGAVIVEPEGQPFVAIALCCKHKDQLRRELREGAA